VIAVYNVFNNEKTIRESLESVVPFVKWVVALDGAYKRFPHEKPFSTDGTKQIFEEVCGEKLIGVTRRTAWESQVAKKTRLLNLIPEGQWFLRIAADEVITGEVAEAFKFAESSSFTCIGVPLKNFFPVWSGYHVAQIGGRVCPIIDEPIPKEKWDTLQWKSNFGVANRIIRKREGMQFKGHHGTIYIGTTLMRPETRLDNVLIINMPHKIGYERWHEKLAYKRKRYEEKDFEG